MKSGGFHPSSLVALHFQPAHAVLLDTLALPHPRSVLPPLPSGKTQSWLKFGQWRTPHVDSRLRLPPGLQGDSPLYRRAVDLAESVRMMGHRSQLDSVTLRIGLPLSFAPVRIEGELWVPGFVPRAD